MASNHSKIRLLMKLRNDGITDTRVLSAIETVPREAFLPEMFHDRAYEDTALPIGHGQTISQPLVVAMMTEALEVTSKMKVLEIGTGSGYQAAILSRLCRRVYSIERHKPLLDMARERFAALKLTNISTRAGDGMLGWPEVAPFERIIVTAAAGGHIPQKLLEQLDIGGVMVIPMGEDKTSQFIYRITRDENGYHQERLWAVRFVPLLPGDPGTEPEPDDPLATLYKHLPKKEHLI
jgi:protein-L-isoaspartate(D-aspartate) O-methyltransferase